MPTAKKAAVIEELTDKLGRINAAALIEYRGLNVAEISDLRNQLRQRDVELQVTKNTLLREAAHRNNMENLDDLFAGPTAVAFIYGDESTGTKALNDYFRTSRVGEIKSGILRGGRKVSAEQFVKLADLPNRADVAGADCRAAGVAAGPTGRAVQRPGTATRLRDRRPGGQGRRSGAGVAGAARPAEAPAAEAADAAPEAPVAEAPAAEAVAAPETAAPEALPRRLPPQPRKPRPAQAIARGTTDSAGSQPRHARRP